MKHNIFIKVFIIISLFLVSSYGQSLKTEGPPEPSLGANATVANEAKTTDFSPNTNQSLLKNNTHLAKVNSSKVDKTFEGFGFDDNQTENGPRFIPPDPIGAAGKNRVIAVVNTMIESRTKGGHLKWRDALSDFFAPLTPTTYTFDPKIVYDQYEDRFVVVALEQVQSGNAIDPGNISRILLAVSKDGNPKTPTAADWHYHAIDSKVLYFGFVELWADYPGFEVDEEAIYVTANMFAYPPYGGYGGSRLWIVGKGAGSGGFYDGGPAAASAALDPYAIDGLATTTMPTQIYGAGGVGTGIGTFLVSYSGLSDGLDEYVQVVRVDDPLGTPTFTQEYINIGNIEDFSPASLPDAPQSGSTFGIEVNDRRALDCVWRDGMLWITTTINPNSGPDAGETTAHWFKLNTSAVPGNPITLDQQGDIGGEDIATGTFTFFPSVAVNRNGEAKFGFSASASTIYAGAFVAGRQPGDPAGTVQGSETVKAGEAPYKRFFGGTRNRWGDYSGISVDPTNDDFFWVFNEFADEQGNPTNGSQGYEDGRWGTIWGRSKFQGKFNKLAISDGEEIKAGFTALPNNFALEPNYPNPFNPETKITYQLPKESDVVLTIYNIRGQIMRTLVDEFKSAGFYSVRWNGKDNKGLSVPSGTYFYKIKAGNEFVATNKMLLLK